MLEWTTLFKRPSASPRLAWSRLCSTFPACLHSYQFIPIYIPCVARAWVVALGRASARLSQGRGGLFVLRADCEDYPCPLVVECEDWHLVALGSVASAVVAPCLSSLESDTQQEVGARANTRDHQGNHVVLLGRAATQSIHSFGCQCWLRCPRQSVPWTPAAAIAPATWVLAPARALTGVLRK